MRPQLISSLLRSSLACVRARASGVGLTAEARWRGRREEGMGCFEHKSLYRLACIFALLDLLGDVMNFP